MYYTVYKITNLINNKIYIGVHKTNDLNDNYMGSGCLIKKAIKKHGLENFKKEYIEIFDNLDDMFKMEINLVNKDFILNKNTYNLKIGGLGGWLLTKEKLQLGRINANKNGALIKAQQSLRNLHNNKEWVKKKVQKGVNTIYQKYGKDKFKTFLGKQHKEESKRKIGEKNSQHQKGENNSQFGTIWIYNLELQENKKINKNELYDWELKGGLKGRNMNFYKNI